MKIEVKWINGQWRSFSTSCSHFSAGISEIVDLVENELNLQKEKDQVVKWKTNGKKFVAELIDKPAGKLSKSDQNT